MDRHVYTPDYAYDSGPGAGGAVEVAPGIYWLRMALPFALDHINLWLLEDGNGWTIVDTGIARDEVKEAWEQVFGTFLTAARPLKRVIVTHFHPDHLGLAGWLVERFDVALWMPRQEWAWGRMLSLDGGGSTMRPAFDKFYRAAGFDEAMMRDAAKRPGRYARMVSAVPGAFRCIADAEIIAIGGRQWRVITGAGHSPEHACLHCGEINVLISGDLVLPKISPNISVWLQEPDAEPLSDYLASLEKFRGMAPETLVLPSHNLPFRGLEGRLDDLAGHHEERLEETLSICAEPVTGVEVLRQLFKRKLDTHQLFFAAGEALAHLHHLMGQGKIRRRMGEDGVYVFERHDGATLP